MPPHAEAWEGSKDDGLVALYKLAQRHMAFY